MYQKFIITDRGVLRFGHVYLHRDLLQADETCEYGGGLWKVDDSRGAIILYGRSFDFGTPDINQIQRIEWEGVGGNAHPLLYAPKWPNEDQIIPVFARSYY